MVTKTLPIAKLQMLRQHLAHTLQLSLLENEPQIGLDAADGQSGVLDALPASVGALGDMFWAVTMQQPGALGPNVEGRWFLSSLNPAQALLQVPNLWLKPNLRLVTYLLRTPDGGLGQTCAVPDAIYSTLQLERALPEDTDWHYPPFPDGALHQVMDAFEGDRSPLSFLVASLWRRELKELGAKGRDQDWAHHRMVETPPPQWQWDWKGDRAEQLSRSQDLRPRLRSLPDGGWQVEFFTVRTRAPHLLICHLDSYGPQGYGAKTKDQVVAVALD
jgi:hypothetical protein